MIFLRELNKRNYPTDNMIESNLLVLCKRLNMVRAAYAEPMIITSGLRSEKQQSELIKAGKSKATKSRHLTGHAADVADPDGKLAEWLLKNVKILEEACLWCEHPDHTPGWVHFQCVPPGSGNRFFIP